MADSQDSDTPKAIGSQVATRSVSIVKLSSLRPSQQQLYKLIVSHLEDDSIVTLKEAEQIWRSRVHANNSRDGEPLRYEYYYVKEDDNYQSRLVLMSQEEITWATLNWLTKNIGLLVLRGCLKVIPMIEVEHHTEVSDLPTEDSKPSTGDLEAQSGLRGLSKA